MVNNPPPRNFLTLLLVIFCYSLSIAQTPPCPPPPNCGVNPQYFCGEVTDFNWAIIPNGTGQYNVIVRSLAFGSSVPTTFYLMSGTTVLATANGTQAVFENIQPGCYTVIICTDGDVDFYCCKDLRCPPVETGCCELAYRFYSDMPNPTWQFGDNTSSTSQNPVHEYTNINTYPLEGTPQTTVQLSWGSNTIQSILQFPQGIWVGADCQDVGNSSALVNSINPALLVFPVLSYQDRRISIKGSITMNQNYQFTGCDFCMHPASRIVSVANPLSFLGNTTLHEAACKNRAWYGIEVRQGSIVGNTATFTGAYNAIRTPAGLTTAPVYRFTDCQFNRNYLGINIASPVTFGTFKGNTFGANTNLALWPGLAANTCSWVAFINKPANLTPFAGIYAETPAGAAPVSVILPTNIPFTLQPNVFINLSNGIYLKEANGTIISSRFENMIPGAYPNDDGCGIALFTDNIRRLQQWGLGKNLQPLTFDNCLHAVFVRMNPQFTGGGVVLLRSYNNNMDVEHGYTLLGNLSPFQMGSNIQNNNILYTGGYGILVTSIRDDTRMVINRNRVETNLNTGVGVILLNWTPQPLGGDFQVSVIDNIDDATNNDGIFGGTGGITLATFSNSLVENNTISGFQQAGIQNGDSPQNNIRCNNIFSAVGFESIRNATSTNTTIEFNQTDATAQGIAITNVSNNTRISCNNIGSHDIGLFYDAFAVTGAQLPGNMSAGNDWTGIYTTLAANMEFGGDPTASQFFYRNGEINPAQISTISWFTLVTEGINCPEGCPPNEFAEREETELDNQIADGSLDPEGLPGYLLKRNLYNDLLYYPELLQGNNTLQQFHGAFAATNGGKLVSLEKAMVDAVRLTSQQQTQWDAAKSDLDATFDQWAVLDSLVQNGSDADTQKTQRETAMQTSVTAESVLNSIYADNLTYRTGLVDDLQDILYSIVPQTQWETNERTLNEIYLHTAFIDQAPDSIQTEEILQIAEQCLADGGPAVSRARNWYFSLTGIRVEVECNGILERGINSKEANLFQLIIRPNPARDKIFIQIPDVSKGTSRLEIFDIHGKLQQEIHLPDGISNAEVSTAGWSNGHYFCRLTKDGQTIATSKFSIQH